MTSFFTARNNFYCISTSHFPYLLLGKNVGSITLLLYIAIIQKSLNRKHLCSLLGWSPLGLIYTDSNTNQSSYYEYQYRSFQAPQNKNRSSILPRRMTLGMCVPNCVNKLPFPHIRVNNYFFNDRYSDWIRWDQNVVLVCISLIANEIEHFSYVYWPFIFSKLFISLDHSLIRLFDFL